MIHKTEQYNSVSDLTINTLLYLKLDTSKAAVKQNESKIVTIYSHNIRKT